jgi:hypothetical protein
VFVRSVFFFHARGERVGGKEVRGVEKNYRKNQKNARRPNGTRVKKAFASGETTNETTDAFSFFVG